MNKNIAKKLNINYDTSIVSKAGDQHIVIEDMGYGLIEEQPDLYRVIAFIPKFNEKNKVVHDIVGEMYYYLDEEDKENSSLVTIVSKENQDPLVTAEMLKYIEAIGAIKELRKVTIMASADEISMLNNLGYYAQFTDKETSKQNCFPLSKSELEFDLFENNFEALLKQAKQTTNEKV